MCFLLASHGFAGIVCAQDEHTTEAGASLRINTIEAPSQIDGRIEEAECSGALGMADQATLWFTPTGLSTRHFRAGPGVRPG
jgi:hypothetical protein